MFRLAIFSVSLFFLLTAATFIGGGGSSITGLTTGTLPVAASSSTLGDSGIAVTETAGTVLLAPDSGGDTDRNIKIRGKGLGFLQLGQDTYGPTYETSLEIVNYSATTNDVYGAWLEIYTGNLAASRVSGLSVVTDTPSNGSQNQDESLALLAYARSSLPSGRTIDDVTAINAQPYVRGGGTATNATGTFNQVLADTNGIITNGYGNVVWMYNLSPTSGASKGYAYYSRFSNTTSTAEMYTLWSGDLAGKATHPYYLWLDSRGVYRIREDNTFNSVGQAIPALYNPQFTKYTPGAANYERIVQQWNSNIAEIGAEAGGTGTSREVRLIGAGLRVPSLTSTGSAGSKNVVCVDTSTGKLYASSTGTDCSN